MLSTRLEHAAVALVALATVVATATPAAGQEPLTGDHSRYAHLEFLLERTLFKVDVARLHLEVDDETARDVAAIVAAGKRSKDRERKVADRYLATRQADVALEFLMDIDLDRFLEGGEDNVARQIEAGLMAPELAEPFLHGRRERFAFLEGRGIRDGDRFFYTLRGDSVATRFVDADGVTRIDDVRVGPTHGQFLMGTYFAPGSSFRDGLLDLVFDGR
jgi:hypothetical protein